MFEFQCRHRARLQKCSVERKTLLLCMYDIATNACLNRDFVFFFLHSCVSLFLACGLCWGVNPVVLSPGCGPEYWPLVSLIGNPRFKFSWNVAEVHTRYGNYFCLWVACRAKWLIQFVMLLPFFSFLQCHFISNQFPLYCICTAVSDQLHV